MAEKIEDTTPEETPEVEPEVGEAEVAPAEAPVEEVSEASEPAVDILEDARTTAEQNVRNETAPE